MDGHLQAGEKGPEFGCLMRVMMDGKKDPNGPLANIVSFVIMPVRSKLNSEIVKTETVSTEELSHFLEEHNNRVENEPEVRVQPSRAKKIPLCKV